MLPESIQSSICLREVDKALSGCHELNTWLAAHLGDIFDKLELVYDNDKYEYSFRDYFLLEYADSIMDSSSEHELWRVIAQYLAAAGEEGRNRLREFIVRVSVRLDSSSSKEQEAITDNGMDVEGSNSVVAQFQDLIDLRATCQEFNLHEEFETIGQIVAERLVRRGDYGKAAAICLMAENGFMLSRIAEKILTSYVEQGPEKFLELVGTLPAQALYDEDDGLFSELALAGNDNEGGSASAMAMYAARLQFLSDLRDYLLFLKRDDRERAAARLFKILTAVNTPVEFWSVLLADSVELLEGESTG